MSLFDRKITVDVVEEGDCLRMRGKLEDTRSGIPLHLIEVEMLMTVWDGAIKEISGEMPNHPLEECVEGLKSLQELLGQRIVPGFSEVVKTKVGGAFGCTHMASLILNMGNVSVQGRGAYLRTHMTGAQESETMKAYADELNLLDSCVCWREDGPLIRRWRNSQGQP